MLKWTRLEETTDHEEGVILYLDCEIFFAVRVIEEIWACGAGERDESLVKMLGCFDGCAKTLRGNAAGFSIGIVSLITRDAVECLLFGQGRKSAIQLEHLQNLFLFWEKNFRDELRDKIGKAPLLAENSKALLKKISQAWNVREKV